MIAESPGLVNRFRKRTSYRRPIDLLSQELLNPRTRIYVTYASHIMEQASARKLTCRKGQTEGHGEWLGVRDKNSTPKRFRMHVMESHKYVGLGGGGVRVRWAWAMYNQRAGIRRSQRLEPSRYGWDPSYELTLPSEVPYRGNGGPTFKQHHLQQV